MVYAIGLADRSHQRPRTVVIAAAGQVHLAVTAGGEVAEATAAARSQSPQSLTKVCRRLPMPREAVTSS